MKIVYQFLAAALVLCQPLWAQTYQYNVQLQMADVYGAPIANTAFWITLNVAKNGNQITVFFPTINFQVGQCASGDTICTPTVNGFLITASGFLPPDWRPNALIPVSVVASSGDGLIQSGTPPSGYIVLVDNAGSVMIQQAGAAGNELAVGAHTVLPCTLSYTAGKAEQICFNFQISEGQIDVNQFNGSSPHGTAIGDNIRDTHINDAFDNTFAWAWTDNHNVSYSAQTLNLFIATGQIDKKGRFKMGKPIQLTNFPPNMIAWDTSIAINRQNKNNIVVSYGVLSYNSDGSKSGVGKNARAVSFDGGKTWGGVFNGVNSLTYNGLISYQPSGGFGDIPGVRSDQFGNFWFGSSDDSTSADIPYLLLSTDQGVTWSHVYSFPEQADGTLYDYPHMAFGSNGTGQYGVWYYADYYTTEGNVYPVIAFIPITGLGSYGSATTQYLTAFENSIQLPSVTVSNDGRFWALGTTATSTYYFNIPIVSLYKSPGTLGENYAGPWLVGSQNQLNAFSNSTGSESVYNLFQYSSVPYFGYFLSVQQLLYDDSRQALYAIFSANSPTLSQNMNLYFAISRNNGLTWSPPYSISTTGFGNRGFISMALDNGNLYIGWYDGRNDPSLQKIQYFGGTIPAKKLDSLVNQTPLSYPVFTISGQGSDTPPS